MTLKLNQFLYSFGVFLLISTGGCGILSSKDPSLSSANTVYYTNPILDTVLADPTVFLDPKSGFFYAYGTEDNWADGQGSRLIPVMRSKDLVNWTLVSNAFQTKPTWKERGGLWAPDINYVDGKYYLYYSFSIWDDPNPGIGLAIASSPEGPFIDQGKLFTSKEIDVPNSIDPFYHEEKGKKYLFWGSYSNQKTGGTYGVELSADGRTVPDLNKKFRIAAGDFEAVMIHQKEGYYYFFGSKGHCCQGKDSKYNVRIARSKKLEGPYLDKNGNDIAQPGNGTLFIQSNEAFVGPGHNAQLMKDDKGTDWFIYHGININQGKLPNGTSRRILLMDPVVWEDGWPHINGNSPSSLEVPAPVFKNK